MSRYLRRRRVQPGSVSAKETALVTETASVKALVLVMVWASVTVWAWETASAPGWVQVSARASVQV
jgi:hypothetical protein